ncbi:MAG: Fic family protein [Pseudomonadota bacterium]
MLDDASRLLGELNAFSQLIPDVNFFIRMHVAKEATTSSRIEGTQTNMEEVLVDVGDVEPKRRGDWAEVRNYITATHEAIAALENLPLSNRIIKQAHRTLLQGVRGRHKRPGEFRISQNWIGVSLKHATFVPPHHVHVPELMSDLEKFMHNEAIHVPHLLKIAVIHYQFETIHPFLDGNGRMGRLLIVLYLVGFGLVQKPALYLSEFFERHKGEYFDHLMAVRTTDNLLAWIRFFLIGVQESASLSIDVFKQVNELKADIEAGKLPRLHTRKQANAQQLMRHLYAQPITSIQEVAGLVDVRHNTASALVRDFVSLGILRELTGHPRKRLYGFHDYIKLFTNRQVNE